ncbi:MAG: DNA polymerase III subunit delta [Candidatus Omnitrophota bacterium]
MVYPVRDKTPKASDGCLRQPVSNGVYLLIGQDIAAKEIQLKKIKQEFLPPELQDFNLDTLYAKEIILKDIQERFLSIPLKSAKRIIVIKDAHLLDEESRDFLLAFSKKPHKELVLVLDFAQYDYKDEFIKGLSAFARTLRFKETVNPDTFALNRQIELRKTDSALRLLNQLLKNGEAPERILGGLRYAWEKQDIQSLAARKKLKLLLTADLEMKTGRLKPAFALEKLVVSLCGFA